MESATPTSSASSVSHVFSSRLIVPPQLGAGAVALAARTVALAMAHPGARKQLEEALAGRARHGSILAVPRPGIQPVDRHVPVTGLDQPAGHRPGLARGVVGPVDVAHAEARAAAVALAAGDLL